MNEKEMQEQAREYVGEQHWLRIGDESKAYLAGGIATLMRRAYDAGRVDEREVSR